MKNKFLTSFTHFLATLTGLFLNGLFTVLPIVLTIALFRLAFRVVNNWVEPIHNIMPTFLTTIPHSELILTILFILLLGIILRVFILRTIIHWFEGLLFKIPLIRPLYSGIKQLVHAFSPQDTLSFKKVVLIEFPRKDLYSIGFVTSEVPQPISPDTTKPYYCVFVPTTPNPTTGFFMFLPAEDVKVIDLNRQEAMALIISGGIIQPERFKPQ